MKPKPAPILLLLLLSSGCVHSRAVHPSRYSGRDGYHARHHDSHGQRHLSHAIFDLLGAILFHSSEH